MPLLTKDRTVVDDRWALLPDTAAIGRRAGFDAGDRAARAVVGAARCAGSTGRHRRVARSPPTTRMRSPPTSLACR